MTRTSKVLAGGALLWTFGVTAARTARPPNDFAEAHWLLDYRFGFVRRGVAGSVLRELSWLGLDLQTEVALRRLAYGVFAVLAIALAWVVYRVLVRTRWHAGVLVCLWVFAASPFVVTSAHLMGYLDHLVFLMAIGTVGLALTGQPWWGAVLCAVSVAVHESTVLFTVPLLAATLAIGTDTATVWRRRLWLPLSLPMGTFAIVAALDMLTDHATVRQMLELRLHRYTFVAGDMHRFVPEWVTTGFAENVAAQSHRFLERLTDTAIVVTIVPAVQALWYAAMAWTSRPTRTRATTWIVAATCAPLVLHLSAWDTARIWSYTVGAALIVLWVTVERLPGDSSPALSLAPVVALSALFAQVAARIPLLDNAVERFSGPQLLVWYTPAALAMAAAVRLSRPRPDGPTG